MKKRVRLTGKQRVDIKGAYQTDLKPVIAIAEEYGVTRQCIYKVLRQVGADTRKCQIPVSCHSCGKEVMRNRARIRKQLHHFCSLACYHAFLQAGGEYIDSGYGRSLARRKASEYFALQEGNIVHHEDRNNLNNMLNNLVVYANQGDHVRSHRGFDVNPLWEGKYEVE